MRSNEPVYYIFYSRMGAFCTNGIIVAPPVKTLVSPLAKPLVELSSVAVPSAVPEPSVVPSVVVPSVAVPEPEPSVVPSLPEPEPSVVPSLPEPEPSVVPSLPEPEPSVVPSLPEPEPTPLLPTITEETVPSTIEQYKESVGQIEKR